MREAERVEPLNNSGHSANPTGRARPWRMLVIALAWGSCFVLLDWGLSEAPVLWVVTWRAVIAGMALLAVATLTRRRRLLLTQLLAPSTLGLIGVLAVMNVTVAFAAMAASTTSVTTGVASVLANAQPLLVVLPAWWLFGERPRLAEVAGVALGFGGLLVIAAPSGGGRGAGLALLAAVGIATGALLARRLAHVDVLVLGVWQFLLGGAVLAAIAGLTDGPPGVQLSARSAAAVLLLGVAATAVPYVLWFTELRRASITAVTAWTLLVPVVGVALGVVLLGERPSVLEIIGDAIVVLALAIVVNSERSGARRANVVADKQQ